MEELPKLDYASPPAVPPKPFNGASRAIGTIVFVTNGGLSFFFGLLMFVFLTDAHEQVPLIALISAPLLSAFFLYLAVFAFRQMLTVEPKRQWRF